MEGSRQNLVVTRSERDLGVQIRDDLKWEDQVNIAYLISPSDQEYGEYIDDIISTCGNDFIDHMDRSNFPM
ncbi:unnamed protein product [Brachionus calyciflorus]|uniref:Uncharacterized protein n=1 Tax=Brachionus calyciflorus TaxID=104777 RepID=A0A813ZP37_9BILA|nr:unnamed protein product [Brachionus calyciflorus]